jgi:hypothetical protein
VLETDASDFTSTGILSQKFEDGRIHPVRFTSRKLSPAEMNYDVHDKEMLAVVFSLKKHRHYLQGAIHKTTTLTEHQNLTYFKTAGLLNRGKQDGPKSLSNIILFYYITRALPMLRQIYSPGARRSPLEKGVQLQQLTRRLSIRNNG